MVGLRAGISRPFVPRGGTVAKASHHRGKCDRLKRGPRMGAISTLDGPNSCVADGVQTPIGGVKHRGHGKTGPVTWCAWSADRRRIVRSSAESGSPAGIATRRSRARAGVGALRDGCGRARAIGGNLLRGVAGVGVLTASPGTGRRRIGVRSDPPSTNVMVRNGRSSTAPTPIPIARVAECARSTNPSRSLVATC